MSNIEKIRQEIERRKKGNMYDELPMSIGRYYEDRDLLAFIDSLPEEKLEEAAEKYADKHGFRVPYDGSNNYYDDVDVKASKEGFLAGAEWQREQLLKGSPLPEDTVLFQKGVEEGKRLMMEDAVEGRVHLMGFHNAIYSKEPDWTDYLDGFNEGDKVKIIIVKQDAARRK